MGKQLTRALRVITGLLLAALLLWASGPGFRSRRQFDEHYTKHGAEFGRISQQEYLERAQALRDAPAGGPMLEAVTPEGIVSRFDRRTGYFGAYNPDRTIRTFFIPNAGERYFRRQAQKRGAD
jgi:pyocin large subunit-like protein